MTTMPEFVEENLEYLDDLPEGCTRNLVNDNLWRAEYTLSERNEIFIIIRYQLEISETGGLRATFSLHQWSPDHGIVATEFLPVGDIHGMTDTLKKKLQYWSLEPEAADEGKAQHFLRFVEFMNYEFGDEITVEPKVPFI